MISVKSVSVVIPVFNGERFLGEAIKSVLKQTVKPHKIFVVDDGSTDNTQFEVGKFGDIVTYIYQENSGPSKARNTGILATSSEFISFLDSDDVWHPKKLEIQLAEFEKFSDLKIAVGLCMVFKSRTSEHIFSGNQDAKPIFKVHFGSSLMKHSVFDKVGLLDEDLRIGEDTEWFFRSRKKNISISVHRDVVQYIRKHENNLTNSNRINKSSILKVLKKAKDLRENEDASEASRMAKPTNMDELIEMWNTAPNNL